MTQPEFTTNIPTSRMHITEGDDDTGWAIDSLTGAVYHVQFAPKKRSGHSEETQSWLKDNPKGFPSGPTGMK